MADLHDSTEHYLATIYEIEEEGIEIKRARIAERLNISAPSVTEHIHRMEKQGLVKVAKNNSVSLTGAGKKKATSVVRRHRLAERLLVDVIGLDWENAHNEADRWEHVISADVEEKLVELLGDPDTCPHGNPIPSADGTLTANAKSARKNSVTLSSVTPNTNWTIRRIGERIEMDNDAIHFVATNDLVPGANISILDVNEKEITVSGTAKSKVKIPTAISDSMYVESAV